MKGCRIVSKIDSVQDQDTESIERKLGRGILVSSLGLGERHHGHLLGSETEVQLKLSGCIFNFKIWL